MRDPAFPKDPAEDPSRGLGLRFPRVLRVRQDKTPRRQQGEGNHGR
jgi:ATP-dependent DNA ligase